MLRPKSVVFDFDYTLADSSEGACECINFALSRMNLEMVSSTSANKTIGLSLARTFEELVSESYWHRVDEFSSLFVQRADEVMADMTSIFPSVPDVLEELAKNGLALGIVSTKFRYRIEAILQREGLADMFRVIVGGEDVPVQKPDPGGLILATRRLGHSNSETLYVGDSIVDAETAASVNIPFIAVLSGTTPAVAFDKFEVQCILENLLELPGMLAL